MFISVAIGLASAVLAVGLMEHLVSKDFFLPRVLRSQESVRLRMVSSGSWVLAVMATSILCIALLGILVTRPAWDLVLIWKQIIKIDPVSMWKEMGIVVKFVVLILFIMSGWSMGVVIDRAMAYSAARKQSRDFYPALDRALREGRIDEAIMIAERNKKSHLAKVVAAGLKEFKAQSGSAEIPSEQIEASRRALERAEGIVHNELKRGLGGLAAIGAIAPFIGLLGTVVGILNAFKEISTQKATGLGAVASGISEALITSAIGLFVAIPTLMMFIYFSKRLEAFDVEMDNSAQDLMAHLLRRPA